MIAASTIKSALGKATMLIILLSSPVLAAPPNYERRTLEEDFKIFGEALAEYAIGAIVAGACQYAIYRLIEYGAVQLDTAFQPPHRARYQSAQSAGSVGVFLLSCKWAWKVSNPILFNGVAMNCIIALGAYYVSQLQFHGWMSNPQRLMPLFLVAVGWIVLYLLGCDEWTSAAAWVLMFGHPVLVRQELSFFHV